MTPQKLMFAIYRNKVFTENATFGYSSMGKFFGFKLHLVIDLNGNIINASITPANLDDRGVIETI